MTAEVFLESYIYKDGIDLFFKNKNPFLPLLLLPPLAVLHPILVLTLVVAMQDTRFLLLVELVDVAEEVIGQPLHFAVNLKCANFEGHFGQVKPSVVIQLTVAVGQLDIGQRIVNVVRLILGKKLVVHICPKSWLFTVNFFN